MIECVVGIGDGEGDLKDGFKLTGVEGGFANDKSVELCTESLIGIVFDIKEILIVEYCVGLFDEGSTDGVADGSKVGNNDEFEFPLNEGTLNDDSDGWAVELNKRLKVGSGEGIVVGCSVG